MSDELPYDAIETNSGVCFVLSCQEPPARPIAAKVIPDRGVELSCGPWSLKLVNLHPRLMEACQSKPISVVTVRRAPVVARGHDGVYPAPWKSLGKFLWYIDSQRWTPQQLAERPFPRGLALSGASVVVATLGTWDYGAPIAMCAATPSLTVLPQARVWRRVSKGLLVDEMLLNGCPPGHPINDNIGSSVINALSGNPVTEHREVQNFRPQLARLSIARR